MQKDDVIYRRLAIEALDECFKKVVRASNMSAYEYDNAYAQGEIDAYVTAIDTVKTLPAAHPEVIRCGDCEHWKNEHLCKRLSRFGSFETKADFYCGYAERKINERTG